MPLPVLHSRRTLLLACLLTLAPLARGDLWESNSWQLTDILTAKTGYDSNLTLSHGGPGDGFFILNPDITLARRDSSTEFQVTGGATHTEFFHDRQPKETDLNFDAVYAYPNAENVIPLYNGEATWIQTSEPDSFLGARVRYEQLNATATGFLPLTGKLGLRGTTDYASTHYDSSSLNFDQRGDAFVGLAYQRDSQNEISLNFGAALGSSVPNDPTQLNAVVHSREYYIIAKMQGAITTKITGDAYAGFGLVDYSGAYTNQKRLPVGGADLTWAIDPVRTLSLSASSDASYSPDGSIAEITLASLTFTQVIADIWQYSLSAGTTESIYSREVHQRTDNSWNFGTEFAYQPSERFRIFLDLNYTDQNSDVSYAILTHYVVSLGSSYRF
jgi:hypothetical protein